MPSRKQEGHPERESHPSLRSGRRTPFRFGFFSSLLLSLSLALLLSPLLSVILHGQERTEQPGLLPELYRLKNGWFGIEQTPSADRLLLLDSLYQIRSQILWRDLHPVDFSRMPGDTTGLLLARPGNTSVLYLVGTVRTPELRPLWENEGKGFDRIVGVFPLTAVNPSELIVALAGDSGIVGIRSDGTEIYRHRGRIKGTLPSSLRADHLYFAESYGDQTFFGTFNLIDGSILTSRPLRGSGRVLLSGSGGKDRRILMGLSDPPTLVQIREESGGFEEQLPISRFPDHILSLSGNNPFVLLYHSVPSPEVLRPGENGRPEPLFYPSSVPYRSAVADDHYLFLVGEDSAVVYDHDLDYLCRLPVVGGERVRLIELDGDKADYLVVTERGSTIVTVEPDPWRWFYRRQTEIIVGLIILPLLLLGFLFFRRYRMMRVMYTNIIRGTEAAGFVVTSRNGRVLTINSSARRYIGIDGASPLARHLNFAFAAQHFQPVLERCRQLLGYGEPFQTELHVSADGVSRTLHFTGRPLYGRYGGTKGYIVMIQDITAVLEQDRLVNWASVAHHIAHEMKTPLGVIRTSAESLRHELANLADSEKGLTITGRLVRQSGRLREIVDDLLTVARTEEVKLVEVDLVLLISSLVDDMQEYMPGMVKLIFERRGEDFRIAVDADQLTIAVRNVIDNARQAIGEREGAIRVTLIAGDDDIDIVISDTGIGMSPTTLARLFQPYYTEKEGGSGIGTVIIKRVVEGHGGSVSVESEKGVGTTFRLRLPRLVE